MGPDVPLLNDYKQEFFWKRFPQTVLGGLRLKLGYCAPPYVYAHQLVLFLTPWLLGGVGTILYQLQVLADAHAAILSGALMLGAGGTLQALAQCVARRTGTVQRLPASNNNNILADEEEVEFTHCVAPETVRFVVPGKRFMGNVVLHTALAGVLCGLGTWYLLPDRLSTLYGGGHAGTGAMVPVFVLSWVTLCIAEYSLIVNTATETATFQPQDTYEITPLTRPLYILAFVAVDLALRLAGPMPELQLASQVLHVLFLALPLLWALGTLSPLDALLLWGMEQSLVFGLGGSPMATNLRLVIMFTLSVCVAICTFFIPSSLGVVLFCITMGYLLSQDFTQLVALLLPRGKDNPPPLSQTCGLGCWQVPISLFFLAGALTEGALLHHHHPVSGNRSLDVGPEEARGAARLPEAQAAMGYVLLGLLAVTWVLGEAQGAYVVGGLLQNPLYPRQAASAQAFRRRSRGLRAAGQVHRVLLNLVSPFAMIAFLSVDGSLQKLHTASLAVGITRAFRIVWQSSEQALLQMAVVVVVRLASAGALAHGWHSLDTGVQLLLVALISDRLSQFLSKLKFALTVLVTSWTETKQRRQSAGALLALNGALCPLLLAVVALSALLSAPLLPLFTLPVFLVAFPRPLRSWPDAPGTSCPCPDSVYYQQLGASLASALSAALARGTLGTCAPGSHFLGRFQDRVTWITVLERGCGYCTVNIKGLELQETSCHTVEARRVDEVFEAAFDRLERPGLFLRCLNPHWGNALTARAALPLRVYSDARNVLTGIIDSPDHLRRLRADFLRALLWLLLRHCVQRTDARGHKVKGRSPQGPGGKSLSSRRTSLADPGSGVKSCAVGSGVPSEPNTPTRSQLDGSSLTSFGDWSDEDDLFGPAPAKRPVRAVRPGACDDVGPGFESGVSLPGSVEIHSLYENMALSSLPPLRPLGLGMGLPAADRGREGSPDPPGAPPPPPRLSFGCPASEFLSLAAGWRASPYPPSRLQPLRTRFPEDWLRFCLRRLAPEGPGRGDPERVAGDLQEDRVLADLYAQVALSCLMALGAEAAQPSPNYVFRTYCGDAPWTEGLEWLKGNKELHQLTLRAFRYSVKLLIDQASLGPVESLEELHSTLLDYHGRWFIGLAGERGWHDAVLHEKPFLFSLGHDLTMGTYTGRVLSLQEQLVQLGRLNAEGVRGQWANLSWELLYATNDDEERYSIQAHPVMLRNLTVQAADPPLGYPIYSSAPTHLPCL